MRYIKNLFRNHWFWWGILAIWLFSLGLRFWGIGRFNTWVFDEVYYAKFGHNYLTNTPYFDAHPPLGAYLISIGIRIGKFLPFGQDVVNNALGFPLTTFSYRWMNAWAGSFVPPIVGLIAYQLTNRKSYGLMAGLLMATDGLYLVESRYALKNIYLFLFGLLGSWLFLVALCNDKWRKWLFLLGAGIVFGCSISTKWNGLLFLGGVYAIWVLAGLSYWLNGKVLGGEISDKPLRNLIRLNGIEVLLFLVVVPALVYVLLWIPHLLQNPEADFFKVHRQILGFHQKLGGNDIHPYCSAWYSWPFMFRPISYFYETARSLQEVVPLTPKLNGDEVKIIYAVHAMSNPFLYWLSTGAILILTLIMFWEGGRKIITEGFYYESYGVALFLVINYGANLLPWSVVSRCLFFYHYMGSAAFGILALAWILDRWLRHPSDYFKGISMGILLVLMVSFIFWLPINLGLPLSPFEYNLRMWFRNWV